MEKECKNCKKMREVVLSGKSEGLCNVCYRKLIWKPKFIICKRCGREKYMQAFGLCNGCYNSVFHIDKVRASNTKRRYGIDNELYNQIRKECVVCGFNKIVDLHHLNHNHNDNSTNNLIELCPNCHKMIHHRGFQKEVFDRLKEKGFNVPEGYKDDKLFTRA